MRPLRRLAHWVRFNPEHSIPAIIFATVMGVVVFIVLAASLFGSN